jgi:cyanophycinase
MRFSYILIAFFTTAAIASSSEPAADDSWLDPAGIRGTLVLCGGGRLPDVVRDEFARLAGGKGARLIVIPTAGDDDTLDEDAAEVVDIWKGRGIETVTTLHTRDRDRADDPAFVAPLTNATAVWITGGRQSQIAAAYSGTLVEKELRAVLDRGGVIGGTSAGAACQSRVMIVRGQIHGTPGLGLIPGAIVDQHFLARDRKSRLLAALERHPALVGVGIDEGTALVVRERSLQCLGDSTVTFCFGTTETSPSAEETLMPGHSSDLTMLRRAARARTLEAFPPAELAPVEVPRGSLVIVGGGAIPDEVAERFVELAGGPDALIVVLPTANPDPLPAEFREQQILEKAGAKKIVRLGARRRDEVESPEFLETIGKAKGIWFGGGRQWRFVDAYEGTKALEAFRGVLARGGVIGGTSAGATIQGEYLVRGSPLGNERMMCPGYERGFAFLPGTAIDQHFSERNRSPDLHRVVSRFPGLLGIGLDEATAIVVQGDGARVLGKGRAHFFDRRGAQPADETIVTSVAAPERFDLRQRDAE